MIKGSGRRESISLLAAQLWKLCLINMDAGIRIIDTTHTERRRNTWNNLSNLIWRRFVWEYTLRRFAGGFAKDMALDVFSHQAKECGLGNPTCSTGRTGFPPLNRSHVNNSSGFKKIGRNYSMISLCIRQARRGQHDRRTL